MQFDARAQEALIYDAFSCCGRAKSPIEASNQLTYVPVNYISPEVYAYLEAAEASAARRADPDALDADSMISGDNLHGASLQITMEDVHVPSYDMRSMPPPKKYFRTFWQSISQRLLLLLRAHSARLTP